MRKQLLSSVSVAALLLAVSSVPALLGGNANAADLARKAPPPVVAPPPAYSWTGCYVGGHVGWGWGSNRYSKGSSTFGNGASFVGGLGNPAKGSLDTSGALFGGQAGCNYQFAGWSPWAGSNWVVGVQGDFAGTDINGLGNLQLFDGDELVHVKSEWLASITGRLGVTAWNNQALFYVKGGVAWTRNIWNLDASATRVFDFDNNALFTETKSGWTVGGGAEWTLWSPNWTAFVEYNFYRFNNDNSVTSIVNLSTTNTFTSGRQEIQTVKVGVNYKWW